MEELCTRKVLVVDDDQVVRLVLHDTVQRMGSGIVVDAAAGGAKALEMLKADVYDLLITDLRLPGLDGVELTKELRKEGLDLPVIWITAYANEATGEQASQLQVYTCLHKPLGISEIRAAVLRALATCNGHSPDDGTGGEAA